MLKESWRPVLGYEDLYQVSNLGRITGRKGLIYPTLSSSGAPIISLMKQGTSHTHNLRRLIWEAFNGAITSEEYVIPVDREKPDELDNLQKVNSLKEVFSKQKAVPQYVKYRYKIPRIKQLLDQGFYKSEIARTTGLTIHTVNKLIEEAGL